MLPRDSAPTPSPRHPGRRPRTHLVHLVCLLALTACGGGGGGGGSPPSVPPPAPPPPPPPTYTVGGTVTGLQGSGLVLRSGGADLPVAASGSFRFTAGLATGTDYEVTVVTQPAQPAQICTVTGGQGRIQNADVDSVVVDCRGTLEFLSSVPPHGARDTTRAVQPALTFSAPLATASLAPGLVTLTSSAGTEPVQVVASGSVLTITPSRLLLPLTDYTLSVDGPLESTDGARLRDPVQLGFRTREGAWATQEALTGTLVTTGGLNAFLSRVVADAAGNTTVVWLNDRGQIKNDLWARHRPAGGSWDTAVRVDESDLETVLDVASGVDDTGAVTVVWAHTEGSVGGDATRISYRRFTPGSGWGATQTVVRGTSDHSRLALAMRGDGTGALVWYESTATSNSIMSSLFDPATGWTPPQRIDTATGVVSRPQVAVSDGGVVTAAWQQTLTGPGADIFAARHAPGAGWSAPVRLSVGFTLQGQSSGVALAADASGRAIVTWKEGVSVAPYVAASHLDTGGTWSTPERVESGPGNSDQPQVVMDRSGAVHAVWRQTVSGVQHVHASRRDPTSGAWSAPERISNIVGSNASAFDPVIAVDRRGNVLAAWYELEVAATVAYTVRGNRFTPDAGWSAAEAIGAPDRSVSAFSVRLTFDGAGTGWATWSQRDSNNVPRILVNRFE